MSPAMTGKDLQQAYSREYKRLKLAMENEFYLEAVSVSYAIIEDRLVAFLHHAGIVSRDSGELKVTKFARPYMRLLLEKDEGDAIRVKDISVKMEMIRRLMDMTAEEAADIDAQVNSHEKARAAFRRSYMEDLYRQIDVSVDRGRVMEIICENGRLDKWRDTRNKLIHALIRRSPASVEEEKRMCAETGRDLSRDIDSVLVRPFKKNNRLRMKYNVQ